MPSIRRPFHASHDPHKTAWFTTSLTLLGGGLVSGWVLHPQISWAEPTANHILVAQQIVDGLPPPPPLIFGETLPTGTPSVQVPHASSSPTASPTASQAASAQRYLVVVNGNSPLLLSQVQTVASGASVQDYQGQPFIQAGVFNDPTQAQQQVTALATQGIGAQVISVSDTVYAASGPQAVGAQAVASSAPSSAPALPPPELLPVEPVPREVEFGQPPPPPSQLNVQPTSLPESEDGDRSSANARQFYVVIPGKSSDLTLISNQVIRLGDGIGVTQLVQESDKPLGPHVRVGPFVDRGAANRWSRYFREFGIDSRVYYSQN